MSSVLISADSHVVEPISLWTERLPADVRERAFRRERSEDGKFWNFIIDLHGKPKVIFQSPHDLVDDKSETNDGEYDLDHRLSDLDSDGVWGEVLYPTLGLWGWSMDAEMNLACARVYNDWMAETFASNGRFAAGAMIPVNDVAAAVGEIERAAKLGHKFAMLPMIPPVDRPYFHKDWDAVWAACQSNGMPASFHIMTGFSAQSMDENVSAEMGKIASLQIMLEMTYPAHKLVAHLVGSGAAERFPDLHFIMVETGIGWLAWVMEELDHTIESDEYSSLKLKEKPSDYIRRQIHATFMDDRAGVDNRHITGTEALLWGSDYPHTEGTFPETVPTIERLFGSIDAADREAITGGTAAKLFGISAP